MHPGRVAVFGESAGIAFQALDNEVRLGVWVVDLPRLVLYLVEY